MLKRYLDESPGIPALDVITDIQPLNNVSAERLGYPTQKPLALLDASSRPINNEGDVVLDPFCGWDGRGRCANLQRQWIGIDITLSGCRPDPQAPPAQVRDEVVSSYKIKGIPTDVQARRRSLAEPKSLILRDGPCSLVGGQPNEKQVADKGIDGRIRFHADKDKSAPRSCRSKAASRSPRP